MRGIKVGLVAGAFCALVATASAQVETIDFEAPLVSGCVVDEVFGDGGSGPIGVFGVNPDIPGQNTAVIFDSSNPSGGDVDLGTPNETCDAPGPGEGEAGEMGMEFENCIPKGNLLIVDENGLAAGDADGKVDDPDDADVVGVTLNFDFSGIGPVFIDSITILDTEADEEDPAVVTLLDAGGVEITTEILPTPGNNGVAKVSLGDIPGVVFMNVQLNGSGAIDDVVFCQCDDDDPCTEDTCFEGECINRPIECGDDDACTEDACVAGECVNTPIDCGDDDECTSDECVNGECVNTPIDCDDQDNCTTDECVDGECVNTPIDCDDEDSCTSDECVDGECVNTPIDCDDQDSCTTDECVDGECVNTPIDCDDRDACTRDVCVDGNCRNTPIDCDDQDACTEDECVGGECVNTPIDCDDNDECTDDSCVDGECVNEDNGECGGGEGCTPGYWKQRHHECNWVGYDTDDSFDAVFGVTSSHGLTLRGALRQGGGGENALGRHAVAALLNASGNVESDYTTAQVIAKVQEAYASGNFGPIKNMLAAANEQGCPLGNCRNR